MIASKKLKLLVFLFATLLLIGGCAQLSNEKTKQKEIQKPQKVSAEKLSSNLLILPRPERLDLNKVRAEGRDVIIDMRSPEELTGEVESLASEYGMSYYNVPFFNADGTVNSNAIERVGDLVSQNPQKAIVHCSSGNRASAWLALYLHQNYEWDIEKAIEEGKNHRLTKEKLMDLVREHSQKD